MVRPIGFGIVFEGKQCIDYAGLSTDVKPKGGILTGSTFLEVDTSDSYFYDEESETWIKAGGDNA